MPAARMPATPLPFFSSFRAGEPALERCAPARGPRRRPVMLLAVDVDLAWVLPVPTVATGVTRRSSLDALVHAQSQLVRERAVADGQELDDTMLDAELVDAAARVVAACLDGLPELPLVGEPFGGEEGTD